MTEREVASFNLRFYRPRMIDNPGEYEGEAFSCPHCLKCYHTEMARAHHIIQDHCVGLNCFACKENFKTFRQMALHVANTHGKKRFVCYFCKAKWQKVKRMNLHNWQRVRHHIYGELVFEKVAEYRQKDEEAITQFMQTTEVQQDETKPLKIEEIEYCVEIEESVRAIFG